MKNEQENTEKPSGVQERDTERPLSAAQELQRAREQVKFGEYDHWRRHSCDECDECDECDDSEERREIVRELLAGGSLELLAILRAFRRLAQREVLRVARDDGRKQAELVQWFDREREKLAVSWESFAFETLEGGRVPPEIPEEYKAWSLERLRAESEERWADVPKPLEEVDILRVTLAMLEAGEELGATFRLNYWRQIEPALTNAMGAADGLAEALGARMAL